MLTPPWTEKSDAIVRVTHPDFAAEKLGLPLETVLARRKELGLPSVAEQFRKGQSATRQQAAPLGGVR